MNAAVADLLAIAEVVDAYTKVNFETRTRIKTLVEAVMRTPGGIVVYQIDGDFRWLSRTGDNNRKNAPRERRERIERLYVDDQVIGVFAPRPGLKEADLAVAIIDELKAAGVA